MQRTYKCKNGHVFKMEEHTGRKCSLCNEYLEPVHWQSINEFREIPYGLGILKEFGEIIHTVRDTFRFK